jgi:uroporphyrin-III C-methyltransferase/precorrin-2 dehydrogenase/sirohydrochlorin ferrochelatase/uroporphyrin-III C-methyltransferase
MNSRSPRVYLVGAGPGDPELLTVKAHRLLSRADAVVYDRLVSTEVLSLVPPGATRIYAGKTAGSHPLPQDEINTLLVKLARSGRTVVRLKGGDPFVFGRGSEEAAFLARHDIPFEVVPGITAASGCTARLGIPLTHRGLATGVRFVTGHCRGDQPLDLNWHSLADADTTLVVYMGVAHLDRIAGQLINAGLSPDTPAAAIASGTMADERICRSTLAGLAAAVGAAGLRPPVLTVIGRVVSLADMLATPLDDETDDCDVPAQATIG